MYFLDADKGLILPDDDNRNVDDCYENGAIDNKKRLVFFLYMYASSSIDSRPASLLSLMHYAGLLSLMYALCRPAVTEL